jgi:hypothetical protein
MARIRRTGSRNWARGVFATFWILLGGISGAYLFTAFTNPTALGGQLVQLNPGNGPVSPASDGTTAAITTPSSGAGDQELAEIKSSISELSEQIADLNARFKPIEKVVGPMAALAPAASVSTSMPVSQPGAAMAPLTVTKKPEIAAAPPAPPPAPEPPAEAVKPQVEAPKPVEAPKEEVKPVGQAAIEPPKMAEPAPAPAEPPAVAVSPMEDDVMEEVAEPSSVMPVPEPTAEISETPETPAAPPATESAALDPTALPPAANDGSTRYGIEIGSVAKQDGLRPLWREFLTNHAALVAGLQPRRVLAPDKKWRLIAGPFGSADEASQACALFKKASRPCEATVYAGDSL